MWFPFLYENMIFCQQDQLSIARTWYGFWEVITILQVSGDSVVVGEWLTWQKSCIQKSTHVCKRSMHNILLWVIEHSIYFFLSMCPSSYILHIISSQKNPKCYPTLGFFYHHHFHFRILNSNLCKLQKLVGCTKINYSYQHIKTSTKVKINAETFMRIELRFTTDCTNQLVLFYAWCSVVLWSACCCTKL